VSTTVRSMLHVEVLLDLLERIIARPRDDGFRLLLEEEENLGVTNGRSRGTLGQRLVWRSLVASVRSLQHSGSQSFSMKSETMPLKMSTFRKHASKESVCVSSGSFAWVDLLITYCHLLETAVFCTRDSDATAVKLSIAPPTQHDVVWTGYTRALRPYPLSDHPSFFYFLAFYPHGISHERKGLEERELFERRYQTDASSCG